MTKKATQDSEDDLRNYFRWGQWGSRNNESISGNGSTLFYTESLRAALPILLRGLDVKRLVDGPCGDFNWMRHVDLTGIQYVGLDIVEDIISHNQSEFTTDARSFATADITKDALPPADLMICRDCLMHLPFKNIWSFMENFANSDIKYLLTTTHNNPANRDIEKPGGFHLINLRMEPFLLSDSPILLHDWIRGARWPERYMGLWTKEDIQRAVERNRGDNPSRAQK
jgi:hypothetical protein